MLFLSKINPISAFNVIETLSILLTTFFFVWILLYMKYTATYEY